MKFRGEKQLAQGRGTDVEDGSAVASQGIWINRSDRAGLRRPFMKTTDKTYTTDLAVGSDRSHSPRWSQRGWGVLVI
jgi:hypothetical protein